MSDPVPTHDGESPPSSPAPGPFEAMRLWNLGWLLRAVGACAAVAAVLGVIVAPGLHGNATDATVEAWDRAASMMAYVMAILVGLGIVASSVELVGTRKADAASGALVVGGSTLVVVLLVVAIVRARVMPDAPLPPEPTIGLAVVSGIVASTAAWRATHAPHTRALAIVIALLALAALVRIGAWEMATVAGERASAAWYRVSRGLATVAVVNEALAQLAAAAWIGSRGRGGIALSTLAALGAFAVTWGAASGVHADAPRWASALHTALADVQGLPSPYGLSAAQSFLIPSAALLALAAVLQGGHPAALAGAMALALVSRGAFDAPLRAIAVVGAAQWALAASFDERILWASLTASRPRGRPLAAGRGSGGAGGSGGDSAGAAAAAAPPGSEAERPDLKTME